MDSGIAVDQKKTSPVYNAMCIVPSKIQRKFYYNLEALLWKIFSLYFGGIMETNFTNLALHQVECSLNVHKAMENAQSTSTSMQYLYCTKLCY